VIRRELHRIDKRHSLFVALVGHGDNLALFHFVASCEPVSVESEDENCQTHRTVGRIVLVLMETPAAIYINGELPGSSENHPLDPSELRCFCFLPPRIAPAES
jgi:hypothetical protein